MATIKENVTIKPTVAREVYDVTGAGDTVLASLVYSLALIDDIYSSLEFANLYSLIPLSLFDCITVMRLIYRLVFLIVPRV